MACMSVLEFARDAGDQTIIEVAEKGLREDCCWTWHVVMESAARLVLRFIYRSVIHSLPSSPGSQLPEEKGKERKGKKRKENEEYHAKGLILILANICLAICRADAEHEVTDESINTQVAASNLPSPFSSPFAHSEAQCPHFAG